MLDLIAGVTGLALGFSMLIWNRPLAEFFYGSPHPILRVVGSMAGAAVIAASTLWFLVD